MSGVHMQFSQILHVRVRKWVGPIILAMKQLVPVRVWVFSVQGVGGVKKQLFGMVSRHLVLIVGGLSA